MKWLQNFMGGRYGVDQFGNFLLGLYLAIAVLSVLLRYNILFLLSLFVLIYCWFRILSRNTYKRSSENTRYLQKTYKLRMWISNKKKKFKDRKVYRYFTCPNCKQTLRVPKGKGAITITCPKCKTKFDKRT